MSRAHPVNCRFAPRHVEQHFSMHCAWTDAIDPNTIFSIFDGCSFGQTKNSMLAGYVVPGSWNRQHSADRGSIDDRASLSLCEHLVHLLPKQKKQRLYVDIEYTIEVLFCLIDQQPVLVRTSLRY